MEKIGVLLVEDQHGILSDIVRHILEAESSIDLVGDVTATDSVEAVAHSDCDAVVWMLSKRSEPVAPLDLLRHHPALRIVAVEDAGERGSLWRMRPHRMPLGRLSPERIVAELRGMP